ncbi:hypothetical protein ACVH9Z_05175 [Rhodococcus opacus]|uniref:Uncharacterized protein n=1 Tax=Rhodococcus opacus TaxID=37919 RepID=A0AAX3YDA5_RHOOP|nr:MULTISPECIES: hypothetical protein [Rhodococcus]NHU48376.1 hypothetical protein [Rhodococcus sp. A14]MBA8961321.1 hypothetical protein [Rhodococcus opacus]MBP2202815.1 hypothetical protein [Rhodococcus opacus]MCZ4583437.1 hypothetical protein [Rhodococcus opacus]MDI9936295.1 hypothetical protein [Rhodococcus sp. IEGM 1351]
MSDPLDEELRFQIQRAQPEHPVADHPHYLGTRVRQLLRELTTVPA